MANIKSLHYVDFTCHGAGSEEVIEEIARHVHAFNREHDNSLGLDFPAWSVGKPFANAQQIRVFGELPQLTLFVRQPRAIRLLAMGDVARTAVTLVPAGVGSPLAAVIRDTSAEKCKPSHARRRAARGMPPFDGKHAALQFAISFTSKTNGQSFLLKLKKRVVDAVAQVEFNSYGVCQSGGVPQF